MVRAGAAAQGLRGLCCVPRSPPGNHTRGAKSSQEPFWGRFCCLLVFSEESPQRGWETRASRARDRQQLSLQGVWLGLKWLKLQGVRGFFLPSLPHSLKRRVGAGSRGSRRRDPSDSLASSAPGGWQLPGTRRVGAPLDQLGGDVGACACVQRQPWLCG